MYMSKPGNTLMAKKLFDVQFKAYRLIYVLKCQRKCKEEQDKKMNRAHTLEEQLPTLHRQVLCGTKNKKHDKLYFDVIICCLVHPTWGLNPGPSWDSATHLATIPPSLHAACNYWWNPCAYVFLSKTMRTLSIKAVN